MSPARVNAMEHDDRPKGRRRSPNAESMPAPTEAELSRIAREAVRQPPDPRLDKELARMGLTETAELAEAQPGQSRSRSVAAGPELERLRAKVGRIERILWVLVAVTVILAVLVVVLFIR